MSKADKEEKENTSKFELLEEDELGSLEVENPSPKLPDPLVDDENSIDQSQYKQQNSYNEFQKILEESPSSDSPLALDKLSEKYKDLKLSTVQNDDLNETGNSDFLGKLDKPLNQSDQTLEEEKNISLENINDEVTNIIKNEKELDAFQELLKLGETQTSREVKHAEYAPEGLSPETKPLSDEKFVHKESFIEPLVKKRKDRGKKYDHREVSIKSNQNKKMDIVHPEQENLYEQILDSVEEKESESQEHTRTMNKKEYFGFNKYALEFNASPIQFFFSYWKSFILGLLSFGLFFKWHLRKSREYLLSHSYFRSYPFEFRDSKNSFSIFNLLQSLSLLLIPASLSFNPYIGLLHIFLTSFSIGFLVLEKYHTLFNNIKYQDINFALNLSNKEYFKLAIAFSFKVVFSFGFLSPKAVRDLQEYLFTKLRYGRIYFRMSHKHKVLSDTPIFHMILPGMAIVLSYAICNYFQINWRYYLEEYAALPQVYIPMGLFSIIYLYAAIKNEILTHLFLNLNIRNSKFQYKGNLTKHFLLIWSNLFLIVFSFGLLLPIAKWRTHKYYLKNIRVFLSKPGGLKEIVDNAA